MYTYIWGFYVGYGCHYHYKFASIITEESASLIDTLSENDSEIIIELTSGVLQWAEFVQAASVQHCE